MLLDHRQHYLVPVRNGLTTLVSPLQYLVDAPIKLWNTLDTNLSSRQRLVTENASLHAQQLLLQAKLQKLTALQDENNQLRALLKSKPRLNTEHIAVAQLLAVATDPLVSEVVLDMGQQDNVFVGQPVLDADGIMGQVIQTGPFTSRVLLITDLRSAISVQDSRSGVRGIVEGRGTMLPLALVNIPFTVDIQVGDELVSSGLDDRFPAGYPVGKVQRILHPTGEQFATIEVTPSAHLNRSQQALLVWPVQKPAVDVPPSSTPTNSNSHAKTRNKKMNTSPPKTGRVP